MRKTMVRRVYDDFEALMMCNAMENCGGRVHSVVLDPNQHYGPKHWHVFGVVEEDRVDAVDEQYEKLRNS
jgi:hypothetical protein